MSATNPQESTSNGAQHAPVNGFSNPSAATEQNKQDANGAPASNGAQDSNDKGPIASKTDDLVAKFTDKKEKVKDKTKPAGGFDKTPLPRAPQGYTVKFTFVKASNLPIADIETAAADPFVLATLTSDVPRRHKEDPLVAHRTQTIRRTTEPVWDEEWIVANVPASGFSLKCRLYDEDWPDHNDRLGNVTVKIPRLDESWQGLGPQGREFEVKKRMGSKRAYFIKGVQTALTRHSSMTPLLTLKIEVLGKSDPPFGQMYTLGPTRWIKHFSPMIGRLVGTKVNRDEKQDAHGLDGPKGHSTQKHE